LICAAMAKGKSILSGVLDSEDTCVMVDASRVLGLELDWNKDSKTLAITGCDGRPPRPSGALHIANSGTTIRFLTAALAATRAATRSTRAYAGPARCSRSRGRPTNWVGRQRARPRPGRHSTVDQSMQQAG
jgi:5-enolpyruvylshikimate-3-phosphate synthase